MHGYPQDLDLFPAEEAVVARAVDKRRREYAAVRRCARQALARIGCPPAPILPGDGGAPGWPPGVIGSMTHCVGYSAAAVARASEVAAVGIDAEPHAELPEGVLDTVALAQESAQVHHLLADRPQVRWDRLLFSAKESVYKTWFPLTRRWLGFEQAHVEFDPDGTDPGEGSFTALLLVPGPVVRGRPVTGFTGRWAVDAGVLVTAVVLP